MRPLVVSCSFSIACLLGAVFTASPVFADTDPNLLGGFASSSVLAVGDASSTAVAIEDEADEFLIFRMADGHFFNPTSGKMAASEAELRALVLGEGSASGASQVVTGDETSQSLVDPLVAAIRQAQTELRARIQAEKGTKGNQVVKDTQAWLDITLAIWDRSANQLRYVAAKLRGTELRVTGDEDSDDELRVLQANGLNSQISVNGGTNEVVVALRYPILKALNTKKTLFSLEDVVYVPYSQALQTPALVEEGERYLDELVHQVFDRLRAEGVRSRAFPERLIADVVDPSMVKSIAAIEHLDNASLKKDTDKALERFFVTLGGNQGSAYNYSRSSADAMGLVQFIPSTYNRLAARPEWGLEKEFERGMQTHENAVRAQAIYLDTLLTEFSEQTRAQFLIDPDTTSEYIVAAYNGGSGRVRRAIGSWQQILNGERTRQLQRLQADYTAAFVKAESLRKKTLAEKEKKKRATLQAQLDAQRKVYRSLQAQIDTLQASLLRQETIGYIEKYRLTKADERFAPRTTTVTTVAASR